MSHKKRGNAKIGGDKKTRDKMKIHNPRQNKKGGRTSRQRGINTTISCFTCGEVKNPCRCQRNRAK